MNPPNSSIGCFPDEIIQQILARLPIKSLFRTKSVSKLWYKLASDQHFKHLYNEFAVKNPMVLVEITKYGESRLICVDGVNGVSEFPLDFIDDIVKVRASCNGLLCCSSVHALGVHYVCNPMTREFRVLPRIPVTRFDPYGNNTFVGIASDLGTQRYSVVFVVYHRPETTFTCMVFDSDSNKWRKFVSPHDDNFSHMDKTQMVFVNGKVHWLTKTCSFVLVLDLSSSDIWRKISLPEELRKGSIHISESDGLLSLIQITDSWMNIWLLRGYGSEEWEIADRVSFRCVRGMVPGIFPVSLASHTQVLVYERRKRVWKEMYCVEGDPDLPLWLSAHSFRSTLLSCY